MIEPPLWVHYLGLRPLNPKDGHILNLNATDHGAVLVGNLEASNLHGNNAVDHNSTYHGIEGVNNVYVHVVMAMMLWRRAKPKVTISQALSGARL